MKDYICDVIRFWVSEFDIDGIRLDAADVLDFNYMQALRHTANEVKPDFWLMGEVIHGDYTRWVNEGTLHSVTNYNLHKALYSGHNDHNYFEIAHTVKRLYGMGGNRPDGLKLYNFVDNHDVERIYTKLNNKAHFVPVHILLYTLPGVPSIYYGSEFGIEGKKERFSDDSLRPMLSLSDYADAVEKNSFTSLIAALGKTRQNTKALSYGDYNELMLTNRQYAFSRNYNGESVVVTVNNDDSDFTMNVAAGNAAEYVGALSGERVSVDNGRITVNVKANSGEIWVPASGDSAQAVQEAGFSGLDVKDAAGRVIVLRTDKDEEAGEKKVVEEKTTEKETAQEKVSETDSKQEKNPETKVAQEKTSEKPSKSKAAEQVSSENPVTSAGDRSSEDAAYDEAFEKGKIAGLQEAILAIMSKNGAITDQMRKDVMDNVYHDSLINWIKSFR